MRGRGAILSENDHRLAFLMYLCTVPRDYIETRFGLKAQTVVQNGIDRRTLGWRDSQVEFYKRRKEVNSGHCYLSFEAKEIDLEHRVSKKDKPLFTAVNNTIYKPMLSKLSENPCLTGRLRKQNCYDRFLQDVLGPIPKEDLVKPLVKEALIEEYSHAIFSLEAVYENATNRLYTKINYGLIGITPHTVKEVDFMIQSLPPQQRDLIMKYYGIQPYQKHTFQELSENKKSREAVHNMMLRLRSKIGKKEGDKLKTIWYGQPIEVMQRTVERERQNWLSQDECNLRLSIYKLPFGTHVYNVFSDLNIRTLGELLEKYSEATLLQTKNFGIKSMREVREVLGNLGHTLPKK